MNEPKSNPVIPLERPPVLAELRFADARKDLAGLDPAAVFDFIHRNNLWGSEESRSGVGSGSDSTSRLRRELPALLESLGVRTLLDLPCGDFAWMGTIPLHLDRYIGGDIVPALVARNTDRFRRSHSHAEFRRLDLVREPLPEADAILCRDCLVHLATPLVKDALRNIAGSRIRFAILTTFLGDRSNEDIETGDWRPLNLERPPFSLPPPLRVLVEECPEENGAYRDKALGVWTVESLRVHLQR